MQSSFSLEMPLLRDEIHFSGTNKELKIGLQYRNLFVSLKPGLLPPIKEKNSVSISSSNKITSSKELPHLLRYILHDLCDLVISDASFRPTFTKYSLKLSEMVFYQKYSYC